MTQVEETEKEDKAANESESEDEKKEESAGESDNESEARARQQEPADEDEEKLTGEKDEKDLPSEKGDEDKKEPAGEKSEKDGEKDEEELADERSNEDKKETAGEQGDDSMPKHDDPLTMPRHIIQHGQLDGDGSRTAGKQKAPALFIPGESINLTSEWPRCTKCLEVVDPLRIQGKSANSWRCGTCNVKMVQLNKTFGAWPIPGWCDLPKEDEAQYWKELRTVSACNLKEKTVTSLAHIQVKNESTSFTGEWLPLPVWKKRGFDDLLIARTSTEHDRKAHPRMGLVYKLTLEKDLLESARQKIHQKLLDGEEKASRKRKASEILSSPVQKKRKVSYVLASPITSISIHIELSKPISIHSRFQCRCWYQSVYASCTAAGCTAALVLSRIVIELS